MNKLTIIIEGLPDATLNGFWSDAKRECRSEFGFTPERADTINIDIHRLASQTDKKIFKDILGSILASAAAAYISDEAFKRLNTKEAT